MNIIRTDKEMFTEKEILEEIKKYQETVGVKLEKLWKYFKVKNPAIMEKKPKEVNNPDNRTPSAYGKKIVTTYKGYAWKPRYTTYKAEKNEAYMTQLQETFNLTNEHLKTSKVGRNIGIFGNAKELLYIDGVETDNIKLPTRAEPKVSTVDPRHMITYYDYSEDPKIKIAIKWDIISEKRHNVDVFYPNKIIRYVKTREDEYDTDWKISEDGSYPNYFGEVPAIDYVLDDDSDGLINDIIQYIDGLDLLTSGSIDEFLRFAESYLRVVGANLDDPRKKTFNDTMKMLQRLKKTRIFSGLKSDKDVTFLTKEIPSEYIKFLTDLIIDQIHIQSHVPDFAKFKDLSGIAVQRVMFDFENVVSDAEANVDVGLIRRIELINKIYEKTNREVVPTSKVTISHKRNAPLNLKDFAETARIMKEAGFSRWLCADIMPDDVIPDVEEELKRQDEDNKALMSDLYGDDGEVRGTGVQSDNEE